MDWLRSSARRFPGLPALVCGDRVTSYAELEAAADDVAATLAAVGVGGGDRVAFWAEGTPAAVAAVWGIPRAGAAAVPLGTRLLPIEAMALTRAVGVRALWGPGPDLDLPRPVGGHGWPATGGGGPPNPGARFVIMTSGTSGRGRPVILTGANVAASAGASRARLGNGPGDRWLCPLPLHHVGGLSVLWRSAREGGTVVLEERFGAAGTAGLLASGSIAFASLVPTMLRRVLDHHPGPFPGLRAVLVGGGPADRALLARAREAGLPALATYGMTETASQVTTEVLAEAGVRPGSAGRPLDGFEIRVVDPAGRVLPPGEEGRLQVRGPAVSPGYLGEPERPTGAWFATGDLGRLDVEGYLYVAGRADDVIITGGEKVHPAAVEAVLREYPLVADARVFGEDDPEWGQRVVAEVAPVPGARLEPAALAAHARARLAGHQVPRRWLLVGEVGRSEMGKAGRGSASGPASG
jgi:O-succinylbenzoic acid--CoA ligase